jgi:hypothetical protein
VIGSETAWTFSDGRELCVVHTPAETVLVLCTSRQVARRIQRRVGRPLQVMSLSIDDLLEHTLAPAEREGVAIGVCVEWMDDIVTVPATWIARALRECRRPPRA